MRSERKGNEMIEGRQAAVDEALAEMQMAVREGKYGIGDNFDIEAWRDDLDELSYCIE